MSRIRAYCELVRLPNVFTAMADIFAGYWLLNHKFEFTPTLAWLLLSSAALYSAGIVFNDLHDFEIDGVERPTRPLPSGRITLQTAMVVGLALSVVGIIAAGLAGRGMELNYRHPVIVSLILLVAILAYDFVSKQTPLGPLNMGACRAMNLLLGASAGSAARIGEGPPHFAFLAVGALLFVASLTLISRGEVGGPRRWRSILGMSGITLATLLIGGLSITASNNSDFTMVLWLALAVHLARISLKILRYPTPVFVRYAVKTYVMSIVVLDAIMASAAHGWRAGLAILALLVPALLLGRWVYST